jgi:hypothetical protein
MPVTLATMHPLAADPPSHRVGALAFFAVGLLAAISLTWHASVPINHDVAWVLQGARRLLDGGRFGRDIVDVNPPLIWWISLIPVQAARLLGADVGSTFTTFVVALCLASVASTHSVLRAGALPPRERAIAAVATAATLIIVPGYDFGQREHLLAVVAVPYVALASVRANGNAVPWWLAAGIGVFAAVGFCLKPHFLAIPALLELWLLANSRRLSGLARVEVGMLVVIGASYALAILAFAPPYLTRHVPEAIVTYGSYSQPIAAAALTYLRCLS